MKDNIYARENKIINLETYKGFALTKQDRSNEGNWIYTYCNIKDIPLIRIDNILSCPKDYVPSGSVEWCLQSLDKNIEPDYYPEWLQNYLHRNVYQLDKWPLKKVFIKPSDQYKRFTGFVTTGSYKNKKKPPFWCSDVVYFKNEWRYYISNGKILFGGWYWGDEINTPDAPELNISIPENYCGALDFGDLLNGTIALIEAQHPFACGWYGNYNNIDIYMQWLIDGWTYMQNLIKE